MATEEAPLYIFVLYESILEDEFNKNGNGVDALSEPPYDKVTPCTFKPSFDYINNVVDCWCLII